MGGPFSPHAFALPKPILQLIFLLNRFTLAVYLLLVFLRLRPQPPPPPLSPSRTDLFPEPQPPSAASVIKARLPVVDFASLAVNSPSEACVVCLGGFEASDEVRELGSCRHAFHMACIDRWIDADGLTCPICRSPLLPPPVVKKKGGLFSILCKAARSISSFIY